MHDVELKEAALRRIAARKVLPGQRYRHYETRDVYVVVAVGLNEPDLEPLVHYRIADDAYDIVWTRHIDVFCGFVQKGDTLVERFKQVE